MTQSMPVLYDTVVVGAGLTGAALAHRLADAGQRVLVLEAKKDVGGLSVHGCGLALLGTPTPYATLVDDRGADVAHSVWELTRHNLELLEAQAADLDVPVRRVGSFRPVADSGVAPVLERSSVLLNEAGFDVELDDATDVGLLIGLQTQDDLAFEPANLIPVLLDHPNVTLRTGVEVQTLKDEEAYIDVWTRKHYVRAQRAVLAAGPHVVHLNRGLQAFISSLALHIVHCKTPTTLDVPWILDAGDVLICERGDQCRMVVRTRDPGEDPWKKLLQMNEQFLSDAHVVERRTGWIGRTPDGLPLLGRVPNLSSAYVVGGMGAWGASWAFVAAEYLEALIAGDRVPDILRLERFLDG